MKKRILIIGQLDHRSMALVDQLLQEGHDVFNACEKKTHDKAKFLKLNRYSKESIKRFLKDFNRKFAYLDILYFQDLYESKISEQSEDGYDMMMAMNCIAAILITEGLKVSLKTEEHARIIYTISEEAFQGSLENIKTPGTVKRAYASSLKGLFTYAYDVSSNLKDDQITVNMISHGYDERHLLRKLFNKGSKTYATADIYYLMMSDDLRYKTFKLFNQQQIVEIPRHALNKESIREWLSSVKQELKLK